MKILSIDTASDVCGVSITDNQTVLCHLDADTGHTHSENLMPMISDAFKKTSLSIKDIDLIVCDIGPGSFTGIRIGVATAKAFSDSMDIPCVGISSLDVLAYQAKSFDNVEFICSMIDCKNDNCYFALYQLKDNKISCVIEPKSDSISNALESLTLFNNVFFIGDGAIKYKDLIMSTFLNAHVETSITSLNSYALAMAGLEYFSQFGENSILPLYLKKPQAQRQLEGD